MIAYSALTQVAGALGTQATAGVATARSAYISRRIDTTVHIARTHVDGAGMVVVTAETPTTEAIVGIVVAIIGIAPVIAIIEGIVPRIPPATIPTAIIPVIRSIIPRIVQSQTITGVIPGIIPGIYTVGAVIPGRMPQQIGTGLLITCPIGLIIGETIVVETLHLLGQFEVFQGIRIDTQLAIEVDDIG
jgi:hypothetical protein